MAMLIDSSDAGDLSSHSLLLEGVVMLEGGRKLVRSPVRGGGVNCRAVAQQRRQRFLLFAFAKQNKNSKGATPFSTRTLLSSNCRRCCCCCCCWCVCPLAVFCVARFPSVELRVNVHLTCAPSELSIPQRFFFAGSNRGKGSGWSRSTSRPEKNWRSREGGDAAHEGRGVDAARSVSPARIPLLK